MDVELTARQVKVTKALKAALQLQAVAGVERIGRVLGKITAASVIFRAERHLQIAELSLQARLHTIVAAGQAPTLEAALHEAIERAEHQALRLRDRARTRKRLPKEGNVLAAAPVSRPRHRPAEPTGVETAEPRGTELDGPSGQKGAAAGRAKAALTVHSFPQQNTVMEPHILRSSEAVAARPMTIEEAVKEAEFRDRDLLIFRNPAGDLFVLHRRKDGLMELVELP